MVWEWWGEETEQTGKLWGAQTHTHIYIYIYIYTHARTAELVLEIRKKQLKIGHNKHFKLIPLRNT
jgi:hypothetical protein